MDNIIPINPIILAPPIFTHSGTQAGISGKGIAIASVAWVIKVGWV